jgi:hypothetical protein
MFNIEFKTKRAERQVFLDNGEMPIVRGWYIPELKRSHCDMSAARQCRKFGGYANSNIFEGMMRKAVAAKYGDFIRVTDLIEGQDYKAGFLDTITLTIGEE